MAVQAKNKPAEAGLKPGLLLLIRTALTGAVLVAIYLAVLAFSGGKAVGCGPDSGCDQVLQSKWSTFFGIPASLLALPLYGLLLVGTRGLTGKIPPVRQCQTWAWVLPCAVAVAGAAVWFVVLQLFVLHKICAYCMTAHLAGGGAALLLLCKAPYGLAPEKAWQLEKTVFVPFRLLTRGLGLGLAAVALLAIGQVVHHPKTFISTAIPMVVTQGTTNQSLTIKPAISPVLATGPREHLVPSVDLMPPPKGRTNAPVVPSPPPPQSLVPPITQGRVLDLYNGAFKLNLEAVPTIGWADSPHKIVSLFDYTCHHCRLVHGHLLALERMFPRQLAIVNLPMPLDANCNFTLRRTPRAHTNACIYARLGLSVWRANRQAHQRFEEFIFSPETPPSLEAAVRYAVSLTSADALKKAGSDPWVEEQLQTDIRIYATNMTQFRNGAMPQLLIGTNLISGVINNVGDLLPYLKTQWGLQPPP
jgi:uncharacterized membrane protein